MGRQQSYLASLYLVLADLLGSKAVDSRALLAGVRSRIHIPAMRYSIVSSWLVRPISSASMARQLLSRAAACMHSPTFNCRTAAVCVQSCSLHACTHIRLRDSSCMCRGCVDFAVKSCGQNACAQTSLLDSSFTCKGFVSTGQLLQSMAINSHGLHVLAHLMSLHSSCT